MRLLFVSPVGAIGGAERMLLNLLASLRAERPDIGTALIVGGDGPLVGEARSLGAEVRVLSFPIQLATLGDTGAQSLSTVADAASYGGRVALAALSSAGYVARLRCAISELRPTLVHSNGLKTHILSALVTPTRVPVIWWMHDFVTERRVISRLLPVFAPRVKLAVAISNAVAADTKQLMRNLRVRTIHNATDTAVFAPGGECADLDALAGLSRPSHDCVRVGLVATYARWKGHDTFLTAAARVRHGRRPGLPPIRFYLIGGPIYQTKVSQFSLAELRSLAAAAGVLDGVGFVPFQNDTSSVYRALDVVVHASSRPEPFGLTIIEAMACGRAVIVSNAGGAVELFAHGVDALGFAPGDACALSLAIEDLARAPSRRAALGAAARRTSVSRFSRDRLGREMLEAYATVEHFRGGRSAAIW